MAAVKLYGQAYKRNPWPVLQELHQQGPVTGVRIPVIGRMKLAITHEACLALLKDTDRFAVDARNAGRASQTGLPWMPQRMALLTDNMLSNDARAHKRLRQLVDAPFRRAASVNLRPAIEAQTDALLDEVARADTPDLVAGLARPLPLLVICEMLGLPRADRARFTEWMTTFSQAGSLGGLARLWPTLGRLMTYLREQFEAVRAAPRPGLISDLVHAEAEGDRLNDDELLSMIFLLFVAGHETTTHLIGGAALALIDHPEQKALFMSGETAPRTAIDEIVRHVGPVRSTTPRFARKDMVFFGETIKRGERMMAYLAAANHDPHVFDTPERFDLTRDSSRQIGFGNGPHLCLGLHLARLEAEIALTGLFGRWPHVALACPRDAVRWISRYAVRGPKSLPIRLHSAGA